MTEVTQLDPTRKRSKGTRWTAESLPARHAAQLPADMRPRPEKPKTARPKSCYEDDPGIPTEHEEQVALVSWFDDTYPELAGRLAAVPNASRVPKYVGHKLNQEGRRKGYPDLQLLLRSGPFPGLIIEMKRTKGGSLEKEQRETLAWLAEEGYRCEVCKGAEPAKVVIADYLTARLAEKARAHG